MQQTDHAHLVQRYQNLELTNSQEEQLARLKMFLEI